MAKQSYNYLIGVTRDEQYAVLDFLQNVDNDQELYQGVSRQADFPRDAGFKLDPSFHRKAKQVPLGDFLWNPDLLVVGSARARALFEEHGGTGLEMLPVTITDHGGRALPEPYVIIHPVGLQPCLDEKKSKFETNRIDRKRISNVTRLVVDESRIASGVAVVRMARYFKVVLFRRDLASHILAAGLTGIEFTEIDKWTDS